MQSPEGNAQLDPDSLDTILSQIPNLAAFYDGFNHSLDPFSEQANHCEKVFNDEVAEWFDSLLDSPSNKKPSFRDFRRLVILLCKRHLKASRSPTDTPCRRPSSPSDQI